MIVVYCQLSKASQTVTFTLLSNKAKYQFTPNNESWEWIQKIYKEHFLTKVFSLVDGYICITSILSVRLSFIASCLEGGGQKKLFCHYNVKASALPNVKCSVVSLLCSVSSHAEAEACVFSPVSHKCCQLFEHLGVLSVNFSDNVQPQECFLPWSANLDLDKVDSPVPQPSLVSLTVYQFVLASEKASLWVTVVSTFWSFCGAWFGAFLTVKILSQKIHLPTRFCPASTAENDFLIIHYILFNKSLCLLT